MKYIVTGGGSGGHIYPLISFINIVKTLDQDATFLFVGKKGKMEAEIVPALGIPFQTISSTGTKGKITWQNVKAATSMFVGFFQAKKIIKEFNPDFCIGAGGYVSVPIMMAAQKNPKIITAVFESDQFMGRANLQLAKNSDVIFSGIFDIQAKYFPQNDNYYQVGTPRSEELAAQITVKNSAQPVRVITYIGGSLGAETINNEAFKLAKMLEDNQIFGITKVNVITGKRYYEALMENEATHPSLLHIQPFVEDMASLYDETDILITRSGAGLLAEAATYGIPTILIPSPNVANNHQHHNATYFTERNAAYMVDESEIRTDEVVQKVLELVESKEKRETLSENMKKIAPLDAVTRMYNILIETKKEKSNINGNV